ncbi:MAG: hypothetical protein ACE5G0_04430 [Rhodothermales bacterium]
MPASTCSICSGIPDRKFVETLHTDERLPEQVEQLLVLGGYGQHGSEQVRKCPECGTYYSYLYDHDSESGMGYGYTDEAITRLTPEQALDLIEKTCKNTEHEIAYWSGQRYDYPRPDFARMHRGWLEQLVREREALRSLLGRNP